MIIYRMVPALCVLSSLVLGLQPALQAQTTPFLSHDEIRMLANEISGDRSFEHIRWLTHWHRNSGMEGYFKAVDYIVQAAKDAGLEDVRFIEQPLQGPNYTARSAELWMVEPVRVKLADIGDHALYLADGSHDADVTAELIWIGQATEANLAEIDVTGKIVLTSAFPQDAVRRAVWEKGAAGVVSFVISEGKSALDFPDQIAWTRIPVEPPEGKSGTFAFTLPPRKGETLRKILQSEGEQDYFATGKKTPGGKIVVHARVDTEIGEAPGRTGFVEGWIRGTERHDQQIVLTAHLQEEQGSANDDGSGSGNLLEIARTLNKLIREGKVERPARDIRFWWTDEIYSEFRYFQDHPEEPAKMLANLHQDMTGANQALGSRVQHLIFAPHSRTSYLDTLFESIGTFLIQSNNAFLAPSRQGGLPRPFTRPIYSTRGTRQAYNARFVPYFDSSDHLVFVDGAIGVPAVALINWDDNFIHSSDDDLDKVDQTQLQRNAFLIGSMAYYLAFRAGPSELPLIAHETFSQGARRLANDLTVALRQLQEGKAEPEESWKLAGLILEQGLEREIRALESIRVFQEGTADSSEMIRQMVERMRMAQRERERDLETAFRQIHGGPETSSRQVHDGPPVEPAPSAQEMEAAGKVPVNVDSLEQYFSNRRKIDVESNLHPLMRAEVFNFVDGNRSYHDIYRAVAAEALAAGNWYYGTVTLSDVVSLLEAAVEAGALKLK